MFFFPDGASDTSSTVSSIRIRKSKYNILSYWNTFGIETRTGFEKITPFDYL